MATVMQTDRLLLREMEAPDADFYFRLHSDPEVLRYLAGSPPASIEEQRARIATHRQVYYADRGFGLYAVTDRASGALLGRAGFLVWEFDGVTEIEVAYTIAPEAWGKGYATEAAGAVRDYGFHKLDKARLISLIMPANAASIRVVEKLGARYERNVDVMGHDARMYVHLRD
ncbi:MAG: GNAT family N-acetyltransferase [Candidatus Eremiobacteraeota bacterium]|nr:GNAT family N-acetyltransferase [Candidatus Eremiobacteraeota bacterium]